MANKTILVSSLLLLSGAAFAQDGVISKSFKASDIKEAEIKVTGSTLKVTAAQGKEATVNIKNLDLANCTADVRLKKDKELEIKVRPIMNAKTCNADIAVSLPSKTKIDIDALNVKGEASGFERELSLDASESLFDINNFKGDLEIDNRGSQITAKGEVSELDIDSRGGKTAVTFTKAKVREIELEGDGEVALTFPSGTDISKINIKDASFNGSKNITASN